MDNKFKKLIAVVSCIVMGVSSSIVANADAKYAPTSSSSYYTEEYIVNRNGVSYNGTAHRRTGIDVVGINALDGHISIVKPTGGNFKHCAVDCVFTLKIVFLSSRYNSTVFNTPSSGVSTTLYSEMVALNTNTGLTVLPNKLDVKKLSTTNYKMSNSSYVDTTSGVTLYGAYWTNYNGTSYKVPSYLVRY